MSNTIKNIGSGFSREAIKKAVSEEKKVQDEKIVLNDLANQVAEQFETNTINPFLISSFVKLYEFMAVFAIGIITLNSLHSNTMTFEWSHILVALFGSVLSLAFTQGLDGYVITTLKGLVTSFFKSITGLSMAFLLIGVGYLFINEFNPQALYPIGTWYGVALLALFGVRLCAGIWVNRLIKDGRLERRAVIVGGGESAAELIHSMEANTNSDIRICGIFDDRNADRSPDIVAGYPKLGTVPELVEFARRARVDMLIVSIPLKAEKRVQQLLKRLWVLPVDIRLSAHTNKLQFRQRSYSYEGTVPFLDVFEKPIADWNSVIKRVFDVVVASIALVLLSPVMLVTAIAVKMDSPGPVFFKQKREGFNNEMINVLKFRSLRTDLADNAGAKSVTKNDNRVTKVGRFIRKTSIDELPQLINVLQGSLSLVGPRPHVANAQTDDKPWNEVVDSYVARHKVKPGVTGWAQINGWRGEVDTEDKIQGRVDYDLYYIENWSLLFDMYILMITPLKLLNTDNAY